MGIFGDIVRGISRSVEQGKQDVREKTEARRAEEERVQSFVNNCQKRAEYYDYKAGEAIGRGDHKEAERNMRRATDAEKAGSDALRYRK